MRCGSICTGNGDLGEVRHAGELRRPLGVIGFDVVRHVALGELAGFDHEGELLRGFLDLDHVAGLDAVARDVDALAVHLDVAVVDELARRENGRQRTWRDSTTASRRRSSRPIRFSPGSPLMRRRFLDRCRGTGARRCWRKLALELLLGAQLHARSRRACSCGAGRAGREPYSRLLTGLFAGGPRCSWPIRRSSL